MVVSGLTTWRSAANAPDGVQDVMTIDGAFVSCNGALACRVRMESDAVAVMNYVDVRKPKVDVQLEGKSHRLITDVDGRIPMRAKIPKRSFDSG
jgi:hypothetical protein